MFDNLKTKLIVLMSVVMAALALSACSAPDDLGILGICDNLSHDLNKTSTVKCNPGETKLAYCGSAGLSGHRTCQADGTFWSAATCPSGSSVTQDADYVVLTRRTISNKPGFQSLIGELSAMGHHTVVTVFAEDLVEAFPSDSYPASIRLGLRHLYQQELNNMKFLLVVAKTNAWRRNTMATRFDVATEIPMWYVDGPSHTGYNDSPDDYFIPTLEPDKNLSHEKWQGVDDAFWTPEAFDADVHTGYLPAIGEQVGCDEDGKNCITDLQAVADKLHAWDTKAAFKESQFDGFTCSGEPWYDWTARNAQANGVIGTMVNHNCSDGEAGDSGVISAQDGSRYTFIAYHGWAGGSSIYDAAKGTGYTLVDRDTKSGNVYYAYSCSTGAPDLNDWSLGGTLVTRPGQPIVYMGYDRVLVGDLDEPMRRAFVTGKYTIGEALDQFKRDHIANFNSRYNAKAQLSLLLYGIPSLIMAPEPKKTVRVLASRKADNGDTEACVQVHAPTGTEAKLLVDGREVQAVSFASNEWQNVAVTMTRAEVAVDAFIHLDACDPTQETCRVGQVTAQRDLPMRCNGLTYQADGTYDVQITTPVGQDGPEGSLSMVVSAVTMKCDGGIRSDCFADVWGGARSEQVIQTIPVKKMLPGTNRINISLDDVTFAEGVDFRALRMSLVGASGSTIGYCFVPGSKDDWLDVGLI
jgi:hypothetical protein